MIIHATAAYAVEENHEDDGMIFAEETIDWWYWIADDAEALAAAMYDKYAGKADLAVTQYRVEIPATVDTTDHENIHDYMDKLEWEDDWVGAPIARQNELGKRLDVAAEIRRVAEAARAAARLVKLK